MSMTTFIDFDTTVTAARLNALRKKTIAFMLKDLKEKYLTHKAKFPAHTWFTQSTIHGVTDAFDLSYIASDINPDEGVEDSMSEEEKTQVRNRNVSRIKTRKFLLRKQLFIYLLFGFNPYNKEWVSLKKKFNIEPMMFELRREVRKIGYGIDKNLKFFVYFPNTFKKDKDGKFIKFETESGETRYVKTGDFHMEIDTLERDENEDRVPKEKKDHKYKAEEMTEEDTEIFIDESKGNPKPWLDLAKKVKDIPQPKDPKPKPSSKVTPKFAGLVVESDDSDDEIQISE